MDDDGVSQGDITSTAEVLPNVGELLREPSIAAADRTSTTSAIDEQLFDDHFSAKSILAEREWVHIKGLTDHYRLKGNWSVFLMALLGGMIVFQWTLLAMVGCGRWDFTQYKWLLPILLVQNLGQIIGLAVIVVKSLFKDMR